MQCHYHAFNGLTGFGVPDLPDRLCPCRRVVRIATGVTPQQFTSFISEFPRKGVIESNKPVLYESLDLRVIQGAHLFMVDWHGNIHLAQQQIWVKTNLNSPLTAARGISNKF